MGPSRGARASGLAAIAALRARESLSRPLVPVMTIALGVLLLLLPRLVLFGLGDEARIVRELGAATLRLAALVLALAAIGPADARERGARALLCARPLRPATVILGGFLGALFAIAISLSMLSVALAFALKSMRLDAAPVAGLALRSLFEGAAMLAVAGAAREVLPAGAAALAALAAFALGHLAAAPTSALGRAAALFVPDLEAIGAPVGPGGVPAGRAALLAGTTVLAWLAIAAALAEGREPGRERSAAA
jgi:hypothetical protein